MSVVFLKMVAKPNIRAMAKTSIRGKLKNTGTNKPCQIVCKRALFFLFLLIVSVVFFCVCASVVWFCCVGCIF